MSMITSYKIYDEAITVDMVVSFEEANTPTESTTPPSQSVRDSPKWSPPLNRIYKLNFSVLLDKSKHSAGLGPF